MGRACSVCLHEKRDEIDQELIKGTSYRNIMKQYGLSLGAVSRHYRNHLPESLTKAHAVKEVASADKLLARIEDLTTEAEGLLDYGKTKKEGRDWKAGIEELRKCLELFAKVSGALHEKLEINLFALPQFTTILTVIRETLEPFPEAKQAVAAAMKELEHANGDGSETS